MAPKSVKVKPAKAITTKKTTTKQKTSTGTKKAPTKTKNNEENMLPGPKKMSDAEKEETRKQVHASIEERLKNGTFFPKSK